MADPACDSTNRPLRVDLSSLRSFSSNRPPPEAGVSWLEGHLGRRIARRFRLKTGFSEVFQQPQPESDIQSLHTRETRPRFMRVGVVLENNLRDVSVNFTGFCPKPQNRLKSVGIFYSISRRCGGVRQAQ